MKKCPIFKEVRFQYLSIRQRLQVSSDRTRRDNRQSMAIPVVEQSEGRAASYLSKQPFVVFILGRVHLLNMIIYILASIFFIFCLGFVIRA